jgi:alkanesulfonate monooxygenase SsuD/methylene tetrahydromethanopterin reductase-like flavin-dependent oxidoreductase (luciferase family)
VRLASRQALQLQPRLPRRGVRLNQQAQGLEDIQDTKRSPTLARWGSDGGGEGFRLAGTPQTLVEAVEAFVDGLASGAIRTKARH